MTAQLGENKIQTIVAAVESWLQVHLMVLDTHVPEAMGHSGIPSGKDEASSDFLMVPVPKEQKKLIAVHSIDNNSQETSETFHDRS